MPPSGYNKIQISALQSFLLSCSQALEEEAIERKETLSEALKRECKSIAGELSKNDLPRFQISVLKLTKAFYEKVSERMPDEAKQYRSDVQETLDQFHYEIEGIHIVE